MLERLLEKKKAALSKREYARYSLLLDVPDSITADLKTFTKDPAPIERHRNRVARGYRDANRQVGEAAAVEQVRRAKEEGRKGCRRQGKREWELWELWELWGKWEPKAVTKDKGLQPLTGTNGTMEKNVYRKECAMTYAVLLTLTIIAGAAEVPADVQALGQPFYCGRVLPEPKEAVYSSEYAILTGPEMQQGLRIAFGYDGPARALVERLIAARTATMF